MNRLMLGVGELADEYHKHHWKTLDGDAKTNPTYVATIPPLPEEVKAIAWDEICAIHFIEHLHEETALELLADIYAVLKPGGSLILEQPNLEWICKAILGQVPIPTKYAWTQGEERWFTMWALYAPPHCVQANELQRHRWMYTPDTLKIAVVTAGWDKHKVYTGRALTHVPERDFRLVATK